MDGTPREVLKYGSETVVNIMYKRCSTDSYSNTRNNHKLLYILILDVNSLCSKIMKSDLCISNVFSSISSRVQYNVIMAIHRIRAVNGKKKSGLFIKKICNSLTVLCQKSSASTHLPPRAFTLVTHMIVLVWLHLL